MAVVMNDKVPIPSTKHKALTWKPYDIETGLCFNKQFHGVFVMGMLFAKVGMQTRSVWKVGRSRMKRLLAFILVLTLLVITGTFVSADAQTVRVKTNEFKNLDKLYRTYGG